VLAEAFAAAALAHVTTAVDAGLVAAPVQVTVAVHPLSGAAFVTVTEATPSAW